ncbi:MAG: DUF421 domain-containing protein [Dethiobacteria bacterium]
MIIVFIRTLILITLVISVIRIMGKRQVGEIQPYELAILIMISALAAIPMEDIAIPLFNTIIPILLLFSIQIILSLIALKNEKIRALLDGRPSIVIENGKIVESELKKLRMNINDILELIRLSGYPCLYDIEYAILETNGKLSVIPKSQYRPVIPKDLNIETQYEGLPYPLVTDGNINYEMLTKAKLNEAWLKEELSKLGYLNIKDVFLASLDTDGRLTVQRKE